MSFLSRMKLIYQISLIGLAALSIFAIVAMVLFVADYQRQTAETTAEEAVDDRLIVDGIAREFLNARRREKDFLLRLDEKYAADHAETVAIVQSDLKKLSDDPALDPFDGQISSIATSFDIMRRNSKSSLICNRKSA